ncbi:MAG: nitrous oxide-stimulated promoter family protein [Duncaniella sp.]|nr:nitrous oxide-stimulated promoter family protein [Duncaniella sp.]MDE5954813.1 nitrous oxide-stimulated promoter family protein [Duncaniella sp.]MDE6186746.1 nitrous oxide-stimulated promoter family protein [Duncaniella sp.]
MAKSSRIEKEKRIIEMMIRLYCHRHHDKNGTLCDDCKELLDYAQTRLSRCPFGDRKSSCRHCRIHCYSPAMRHKIRIVMRYSGPRMLFFAPIEFLKHL